jgi:hypothetical protein
VNHQSFRRLLKLRAQVEINNRTRRGKIVDVFLGCFERDDVIPDKADETPEFFNADETSKDRKARLLAWLALFQVGDVAEEREELRFVAVNHQSFRRLLKLRAQVEIKADETPEFFNADETSKDRKARLLAWLALFAKFSNPKVSAMLLRQVGDVAEEREELRFVAVNHQSFRRLLKRSSSTPTKPRRTERRVCSPGSPSSPSSATRRRCILEAVGIRDDGREFPAQDAIEGEFLDRSVGERQQRSELSRPPMPAGSSPRTAPTSCP